MHDPHAIINTTSRRALPGLPTLPRYQAYTCSSASDNGRKRARHLTVSHAADQKGLVEYLPACFAAGLAAAILLIDPGSSLAAEVRLPSPYTCWQLCMMYRSMPTTKSVIAGQGCESVAGALWLQCTLRSQVHVCTGSEVWQRAPLL